jgi:hypothetical protein
MADNDKWLDEYAVWKKDARYTADFTPETSEYAYVPGTAGTAAIREVNFGSKLGDPNTSVTVDLSSITDISKGDFTIEAMVRIDSLYEPVTDDPELRYNIVGQYEDEWADTLTKNWWALEYITDDAGNSEFRFRVYDSGTGTYIANIYYPLSMDWADSYTDHQKQNLDPGYIHVAVVRSGDEVRLFVNGDYVGTSAGSISDWDTITQEIQINGQTALNLPDLPFSEVSISGLEISDYALYWDEFNPPDNVEGISGLVIYPRVYGVLIKGALREITGTFSLSPTFNASIYNAGDDGSEDYPHRMDIVKPELSIEITGLVEIFGQTSDGPLEKPSLQIDATGIVGHTGSLFVDLPSRIALLTGRISEHGSFYVSLPSRIPEWDGIYNPTGTIDLILSKEIDWSGIISEIGTISLIIPSPYIATQDLYGAVGTTGLTKPALRALFTGISSISGTMGVSIPMLQLILEFSPTSYLNLVLNIRQFGLTQYSNYGFNSMCRFNNKHFGANGTAIYDLDEGDTDDGTFIKWNFRSGYIDLEQKQKKKLKQVWMSYKSNGDLMITVVLPDGTEYEYELDEVYEEETGLRLKFGKGIRSKYVAIDVRNTDGSDITLDAMKIMMDKAGAAR